MSLPGTETRAVVLYKPPAQGIGVRVRHMLSRLSVGMDNLFSRRKKVYLFMLFLSAFGILLGSYYASMADMQLPLPIAIHTLHGLLPVLLFTGVTMFGLVIVPGCICIFSFFCGNALHTMSFYGAQQVGIVLAALLLHIVFLLFGSEAFLTSGRCLRGWRNLFRCKLFFAFLALFAAAELLLYGVEFFL